MSTSPTMPYSFSGSSRRMQQRRTRRVDFAWMDKTRLLSYITAEARFTAVFEKEIDQEMVRQCYHYYTNES